MSLGLARDSVHDLTSLGTASSGNDSSLSSLGVLPQEEGGTAVVALDLDEVDVVDKQDDERSISSSSKAESMTTPTKNISRPSTTTSSYGQYAGFAADYADYERYGGITYEDPYAHAAILLGQQRNNQGGNFFCCIFPWWAKNNSSPTIEAGVDDDDDDDKDMVDDAPDSTPNEELASQASTDVDDAKSDDEISTGSGAFGAKLTDNERAAVMARLRLASPERGQDSTSLSTPSLEKSQSKGLLNGLEYESGAEETKEDIVQPSQASTTIEETTTKTLKPILRHSMSKKSDLTSLKQTSSIDVSSDVGQRRRSLFPQQYEQKPKNNKSVRFAPMARVVTVKSKNEMSEMEKSRIWFQKRDYDDFKKTGRMIAKAMCEGGSEIWLASNDAWQSKATAAAARVNVNAGSSNGGDGVRALHSHDRQEISKGETTNGDKWWHKFGHSRRGLEHIASVEEGRQRQQNVRTAIRVVIDEQRRQKIYRKEDAEKLRMLSLQYTTWARDLALAAAASDAEAVEVDFDESRKSREFYILKHARAQGGFSKQLPSFMMPVGRSPQVLDQHTSTQIRYRRKQARVAPLATPLAPTKDDTSSASEQPINDGHSSRVNLAKQAAGFGTEDADVSSILSGLGAVQNHPLPQPTSVGAH